MSPPSGESWERLSLAERVERNRRLLQEVLGLAAPGVYFGKVVALSGQLGEVGGKTFGMTAVLRAILQPPTLRVSSLLPHTPGLPCPLHQDVGDAHEMLWVIAVSPFWCPGEEFHC